MLGFTGFALVGGRLRELLPSDLRYPGAMARESLRAPGREYASDTARRELGVLFRRYGCHTCGTRAGDFVGDHMPPNKVVHGTPHRGGLFRRGVQGVYQRAIYGGLWKGKRQRYYPQCRPCSQHQAVAVQRNIKVLKVHAGSSTGQARHQVKVLYWATGKLKGKCNGRAFVKFEQPSSVPKAMVRGPGC